jgi:predicted negative regulator of RcsB-dependent stress response
VKPSTNPGRHNNPIMSKRSFPIRPLALALALVPWCAAPLAAQDFSDTVRLDDGKSEAGKVTAETYTGLTLEQKGGAKKNLAWKNVVTVSYGAAAEFNKAMSALNTGNVEAAVPELAKVAEDKKTRPVIRQQALYYGAQGLLRGGKFDEAIGAFQALLKEFPGGRFMRGIAEGFVAASIAKGKPDAALPLLDEALAEGRKANMERGWQAVIDILKGRVLEAQGKHNEARAAYESSANSSAVPPEEQAEAKLGIARCAQAAKKGAEAQGIYRELTGKDAPPHVLAGAWNGLADLTVEEGVAKKAAEPILDALYMYLRGVVQYPPQPGASTSEYERSLAGAALAFKYLSDLEKDGEKKKAYADRSKERTAQLQREFPNSPYLSKK